MPYIVRTKFIYFFRTGHYKVTGTGRTMAKIKIEQAAEMVGKSRQALYRKIKSGELSATRDIDGVQIVDMAELLRVFGDKVKTPVQVTADKVTEQSRKQAKKAAEEPFPMALLLELGELRGRLEIVPLLRAQLAAAEERAASAEARAIEAMTMNQRLLVDLQAVTLPKPEEGKKGKRKPSVIK